MPRKSKNGATEDRFAPLPHSRFISPLLVSLLCLGLFSSCAARQAGLTLALLGDVNLGRGVEPNEASLGFLQPIITAADLALANLESPLANYPPSQAEKGGYNLCILGPPTGLLAAWGLDLLSIANNHRYDCGRDGPSETTSLLENAGLTPIGLTSDPLVIEVKGFKLAFFAFDDVSSPLDEQVAMQLVRSARQEEAWVIVSIHWGVEYQAAPTDRQEELAKKLVDAGASIIWGHHPHVLQRCDGCQDPPSSAIIFHSLGNALFDQAGLADTRQSALLLVTLDPAGRMKVQAVPFEVDIQNSRVVEAGAEATTKIMERLQIP